MISAVPLVLDDESEGSEKSGGVSTSDIAIA